MTSADSDVQLDWIRRFFREEIQPLDLAFDTDPDIVNDGSHPVREVVIRPLQQQVRDRGLCPTEAGADGHDSALLASIHEILDGSTFGPIVFGIDAADQEGRKPPTHSPEMQARARARYAAEVAAAWGLEVHS